MINVALMLFTGSLFQMHHNDITYTQDGNNVVVKSNYDTKVKMFTDTRSSLYNGKDLHSGSIINIKRGSTTIYNVAYPYKNAHVIINHKMFIIKPTISSFM